MFNRTSFVKLSVVFISFLLLSACSSTGEITSRKSGLYTAQPQRLFVRGSLNGTIQIKGNLFTDNHDEADVFGVKLVDALKQCGVTAVYHNIDPLSVDNSEGAMIAQFAPDSVLTVSTSSEMRSRNLHLITYHLDLLDKRSNTIVWKAQIDLNQRWDAGKTLADLVLKQMHGDNVINSRCAVSTQ